MPYSICSYAARNKTQVKYVCVGKKLQIIERIYCILYGVLIIVLLLFIYLFIYIVFTFLFNRS